MGSCVEQSEVDFIEDMIGRGHNLLQAKSKEGIRSVLQGKTVAQYMGEVWVRRHPIIKEKIEQLDKLLKPSD